MNGQKRERERERETLFSFNWMAQDMWKNKKALKQKTTEIRFDDFTATSKLFNLIQQSKETRKIRNKTKLAEKLIINKIYHSPKYHLLKTTLDLFLWMFCNSCGWSDMLLSLKIEPIQQKVKKSAENHWVKRSEIF